MKILLHSYHRRSKADFRATPLARELAHRGHDVTLLCIADRGRIGIREHREQGVRFVEAPDLFTGKLRSSWDPWDGLNRAYFLYDERFDVVHTFETRPAVIHPTQINLWRNGGALVTDWSDWWGRGGLIAHQRPRWYQLLFGGFETFYEEHFRSRARATTVISHALLERAVALGIPRETIHWIPNGTSVEGIDVVEPTRHRTELGLPHEPFIICDSAHDVLMGIELVFRALARVAAQRDVLFVMTGRHRVVLEGLAEKHGVRAHFRHLGFVDRAVLSKALSCANAFTTPYVDNIGNRGRWPGRVGNYLPLGRPIVSNPVGEMKALVEDNELGLLAREDPDDFAEAIIRLIDDPSLCERLGRNARKTAETDLTWANMTNRLEACYRAVI